MSRTNLTERPAATASTKREPVIAYVHRQPRNQPAKSAAGDDLARLRAVSTAVDQAGCVVSYAGDGRVVHANDRFLRLIGQSLEDVVGRGHGTFLDPAAAPPPSYAEFWARLEPGRSFTGELRRVARNGKTVWVDATIAPSCDGDGRVVGAVEFAVDVTDQKAAVAEARAQLAAIGKAQAVIEFNLDGTILGANENFLSVLGYRLDEIQGRHHSMFVDPAFAASAEYRGFWADLNAGRFQAAEYKRIGKGGKEVWIQASYNPILGLDGKPFKVVKYATDVTARKLESADFAGQLAAIDKAQAVIEFNLDGTIRGANANFLGAMGYQLEEVEGRHHSMFVEPAYASSAEYRQFWADLNAGRFQAAEYKRIGKGGKEVWIQASYNPILDLNGKPFKVVKYATDVTAQKLAAIHLQSSVDKMLDTVVAAAEGDLTRAVTVTGDDAIGRMGNGLGSFLSVLRDRISGIRNHAITVGTSASELSATAHQITANSEETSRQASVVAAAAEQVSHSVQTVATAAEEMTASIKEIAKNASQASRVATSAVHKANEANTTVRKLDESSANIGKVIKVITSIAQQTNLLALNATIEAARAGEAGKGFAVVANEVKELAKQTAAATEDIGRTIETIQGDSSAAIAAIGEISAVITEISDIQTVIAGAVEEQTATTNEIGRNVGEAARGSSEIATNISGVAKAAQDTASGSQSSLKAAEELARLAEEMRAAVNGFRC